MADAIAHRGPDASGFYTDENAFLGHRRLSIIDLAAGGQPMTNEDSSLWIVYNGEIFNHADVRPELERAGHQYKTRCDTETILHAYEQYGPECVHRFRGMFAFAIWSKTAKRLFCARDRLGIKPFYYFWDGRLFAFASEIKALLEHPSISTGLDESTLPEYLTFGYTCGEQTMFAGIKKLMPGHALTLEYGSTPRLEIKQYWDPPRPVDFDDRSDDEWTSECRRRLEETVRMRLMSDVPLGMFLSGGVDSSAIAGLMKRMVTGPVKTFAVGYNEAPFSELAYARQVAERIGTEHHEVVIGMDDFFNALPRLVWHEDEPISWPSSVSLYFVARLAAEQVKVVLTGEGSDELFAGYGRYRFYQLNQQWTSLYSAIPARIRTSIRSFLETSPILSASMRRKLGHTVLGRGAELESLYLDNFYSAFSASEQTGLLASAVTEGTYTSFRGFWDAALASPFLSRMLYADQKTYLVELLMKQDQMSMACSIESRVPFLDHTFVEFAASVPAHMKLRGGEGKYVLKKAIEDVLPNDIIYRKKMGFPTPLRAWLLDERAGIIFDYLRDRDGILSDYINRNVLETLLDNQQRGIHDATDRIWRLLNLQIWGDIYLTGRRDLLWPGLMAGAHVSAGV